jgi:beta-hydroxylase
MIVRLLAPQFLILYAFAASGIYVHFRGRERLRVGRQIGDHSTIIAPYNVLMYMFSGVPNKPVLPPEQFPELKPLGDNWQTIRDEGLRLFDEGFIRAAVKNNDWGFYSFFRSGWKRFYLKWYDDFLPSAQQLCPKTVALLQAIPNVHGAMFTMLPPGARLGSHRDPFAGSLRYHLGLATPNSDDCHIFVDGIKCVWRDGESLVFDETFIHRAENRTDQNRLILFCDVERPMKFAFMARLNRWVSEHIIKISSSPNVEGEKVGALNKAFSYLYEVHLLGRRLKNWNRNVYYAVKYVLVTVLFAAIVVSALR